MQVGKIVFYVCKNHEYCTPPNGMDAASCGLGYLAHKVKTMLEAKLSVKTQQSQDFPLLVSFPQGIPVNVEDMSLLVGRKQSGKTAKTLITSSFDELIIDKIILWIYFK